MTKITAGQVRAATKERCYDYNVIAMALSDPAIQRLVVTALADAVSIADGNRPRIVWIRHNKAVRSIVRVDEVIATLCREPSNA